MLGEEIGLIERKIRTDMIARQDDALRQINERLNGIDARLDELASRLDQIEGDVGDIERNAKVTLLKRGSRRVA
ncbi:hypothetical protein XI06_14225 [Bradyrhizobium sp. CCBAU 11434]|nr:hypothetical protein [Bradyrhizobium sp. CCBAU 11434]